VKNTRKIRKYNKMDIHKENIQNIVNEHETNKSEKKCKGRIRMHFLPRKFC
jgi:hypothetical protein